MTDPYSAKKMLEETGCDGIMVGRAAKGNPWIFQQITDYLLDGTQPGQTAREEMRSTILEHAGLMVEYKGEYLAIREMRKHISWYTAGLPGSAAFRGRINTMETLEELTDSVNALFG